VPKGGWNAIFTDAGTYGNTPGSLAIDNDPTTEWASGNSYPHEIQIDLGRPIAMTGFSKLPFSGNVEAIANYRYFISTDGQNWGNPVAQGTFSNDASQKNVTFTAPAVPGQNMITIPGPVAPGATATVNIVLTSSQTAAVYTNKALVISAVDNLGLPVQNMNAAGGSGTANVTVGAATPPQFTTPGRLADTTGVPHPDLSRL
jgi:F5/8 type C domain